jgi:glycosyltransferase involved in cell wall biosynthesis
MTFCKISILIPINSEKFLAEALRSVQNQSIEHGLIEIVLILDRINLSLINRIVEEEIRDIPVRIYESESPGIVRALNLGIEKANGEFIARLDHDDVMLPNRLKLQYEFLEQHGDFAAVGGQIVLMNESGLILGSVPYPTSAQKCKKRMFYQSPIPHPAVMFRKKEVIALGGYREQIPEDWDLWVRFIETSKILNLNSPVINYRIHNGQLSRTSMYQTARARKSIITSQRLRRKGFYDLPPTSLSPEKWYEETTKNLTFGFMVKLWDQSRWLTWDLFRFFTRSLKQIEKRYSQKYRDTQ